MSGKLEQLSFSGGVTGAIALATIGAITTMKTPTSPIADVSKAAKNTMNKKLDNTGRKYAENIWRMKIQKV